MIQILYCQVRGVLEIKYTGQHVDELTLVSTLEKILIFSVNADVKNYQYNLVKYTQTYSLRI